VTSLLPTSSWPRTLMSFGLLAAFSAMVAAQSSDPTPRERSSALGHYKVFHDFRFKDGGARAGAGPSQYLSLGSDGALYGTTDNSGDNTKPNNGSMYRVAPDGTVSTVLQFDAATGINPYSGNQPGYDGALYGSLYDDGPLGGGTLYRLHPVEGFSVIHAFDYADPVFGSRPKRVVPMPDGSIVGTTSTVTYKRAPDGTMTVLYPAPLELTVLGTDGNLYGANLDTAFRLSPQGEYTVLHTFDASSPEGTGTYRLVQARDGNFYGTTWTGGPLDAGTAYRMTTQGTVTVLHAFTKQPCGTGSLCTVGPAVSLHASDGLLYGTTASGFQGPNGSIWRMALDGSGFRSLLEFSLEGGDALGAGFLVETPSRALVASSGSGGRFNAGTLFVLKPRAAGAR